MPHPVSGIIRKMAISRPTNTLGSTVVRISPWALPPPDSDPKPVVSDFAGLPVKGKQPTVTITFDKPIDFIEITSRSSNRDRNKFIAYDKNGRVLVQTNFPNGSKRFRRDERNNPASISAKGIRRIEVIAVSDEGKMFYGELRFV